jgi:hypothetical protein
MADIDKFQYWFDIVVKGAIGGLIALMGWDYRGVKSHLEDLQQARYHVQSDVSVVQTELRYIKQQVDKIDSKIDKLVK